MELRHLRSFVVVAEEGNITRAAQRLHISQPPLTRQIQQLEAELDTALFERTSRGVELTDAGRVLLEDARQVLRDVEHAEGRARRVGPRAPPDPRKAWHHSRADRGAASEVK